MGNIDSSEVYELAADLDQAPARARRGSTRVLRRTAVEVKRGMRRDLRSGLSGSRSHLPDLTSKINFDMRGPLGFEVGIDKVGQGHLGNFAAFGSSKNAAVFDHTASLRREAPVMEQHLADVAEDAVVEGRS